MIGAPTLKQVVDSSSQLTTLAVAMLAGTIAAIIGTSYIRPSRLKHRIVYLLFIPGWICLALSFLAADELLRGYLAFLMTSDQHPKILSDINDAFDHQRSLLFWAVEFFISWLLCYLLLWVFSANFIPEKTQ